jgi:hypothetical protein
MKDNTETKSPTIVDGLLAIADAVKELCGRVDIVEGCLSDQREDGGETTILHAVLSLDAGIREGVGIMSEAVGEVNATLSAIVRNLSELDSSLSELSDLSALRDLDTTLSGIDATLERMDSKLKVLIVGS